MTSDIQNIISVLLNNYGSYAGLIAFLAAFFETLVGTGFFLPGSTILLVMGVFAGQGEIDIKVVLFFAFLGALLGDQSNYFLGKKHGVDFLKKWLRISDDTLKKTQVFLDKKGSIAIFVGRFLPTLKETLPFVAGSVKMKYMPFLFWDTLGAIGWSFEFIGIGYIFSNSISLAQAWLTRSVYVLVILIFVIVIIYLLIRFTKNNLKYALSILDEILQLILSTSIVKKIIQKHPKITLFIKNRFVKDRFFGLPFTLLSLSFLYILLLFAGAIEDFLTKDPIVGFDHIVANIIPILRTPLWTKIFTYITLLGKTEVVVAFFLMCSAIFLVNSKKRYILPLFVSTFGAGVFIYITKYIFHRPRPDIAIYFEPTYSFPSGHATVSVALYGLGIYLFLKTFKDISLKSYIVFFAIVLIGLIGLSRIYLGEHYVSDVYSGYLLGSLWFVVGVALAKWMDTKMWKVKRYRFSKFASIGATLFFIAFFVIFSQTFHYKKAHTKTHNAEIVADISKIKPYYIQNLIGINTWAINIIFEIDSLKSIETKLLSSGWKKQKANLAKALPLFWNYKKSSLTLYKNKTILKIWKSNYKSKKDKKIFVALAVNLDSYKFSFIPVFNPDIDIARKNVAKTLQKFDIQIIKCNKPFFGKDIIGNQYFSNGECDIMQKR